MKPDGIRSSEVRMLTSTTVPQLQSANNSEKERSADLTASTGLLPVGKRLRVSLRTARLAATARTTGTGRGRTTRRFCQTESVVNSWGYGGLRLGCRLTKNIGRNRSTATEGTDRGRLPFGRKKCTAVSANVPVTV